MQPLESSQRKQLQALGTSAELAEYERLVAAHFATDPSSGSSQAARAREQRLSELALRFSPPVVEVKPVRRTSAHAVASQPGTGKAGLVERIVKEFPSAASAERAVNAVIEAIRRGLRQDKLVQLAGFGTFTVKHRKARSGRNPQTGEVIRIKASKTVGFKPGKALKDSL